MALQRTEKTGTVSARDLLKLAHAPEPTARIFGVSGSPRAGGNSDTLLRTIVEAAEGSAEPPLPSMTVHLPSLDVNGCIGCERCRKDRICTGQIDGMSALYEPFLASKGLVLVTPMHNYSMTSWMKAFIDRLYCFYRFSEERPGPWSSRIADQGRKAAVAVICEQREADDARALVATLVRPLRDLGIETLGSMTVTSLFDRKGLARRPDVLAEGQALGRELGAALTGTPGRN